MNFSLSSATRSFLNVFLRVGGNLKDLHSRLEGSRALLPLLVVIHLSMGDRGPDLLPTAGFVFFSNQFHIQPKYTISFFSFSQGWKIHILWKLIQDLRNTFIFFLPLSLFRKQTEWTLSMCCLLITIICHHWRAPWEESVASVGRCESRDTVQTVSYVVQLLSSPW